MLNCMNQVSSVREDYLYSHFLPICTYFAMTCSLPACFTLLLSFPFCSACKCEILPKFFSVHFTNGELHAPALALLLSLTRFANIFLTCRS